MIEGEIFDVAVDVRRGSPTFGRWVGINLSAENFKQCYVPEGFAHGFCVLSDAAHVLYKSTGYYAPQCERTIVWNDPELNIKWELEADPIVSAKDQRGVALRDAETFE